MTKILLLLLMIPLLLQGIPQQLLKMIVLSLVLLESMPPQLLPLLVEIVLLISKQLQHQMPEFPLQLI